MGTARRILLACDRREARDSLGALLRGALGEGFAVAVTSTSELPFAIAREPPDLVLLDVAIPPPAPTALARVMEDARSEGPVVLFSELDIASLSRLATDSQASGALSASIPPDILKEEIESLLAAPRSAAPSSVPNDVVALARRLTRREFVAASPFQFLVGRMLSTPTRSEHTVGLLDDDDGSFVPPSVRSRNTPTGPAPQAWAIRKVAAGLPSIIRVGRAADNDVFIDHRNVSKLHAFFRVQDDALTLADAGSRNGTWVNGELLVPKGPPSRPLASGDVVRLAELELSFVSASGCWDLLRVHSK